MNVAAPDRADTLPPVRKVLELLIDYACAAKCPFCYNPPLTPELLSRRLNFRRAAETLFLKRGEGYDGAWFTGGEPTQRKDLPKLIAVAKRLGYRRIQIGTNGWRTAESGYSDRLAAAGLNYARISLHGAQPSTHDGLLGQAGSFAKAELSLSVLRGAGVSVGINFVLCRQNLTELPAFAKRISSEWRVPDLDIIFAHRRGMMAVNAQTSSVTYGQSATPLARAFRIFSAAGWGPREVRLVNFPPCTLPPRLRDYAVDWKADGFADHELAHASGRILPLAGMKQAQKKQGPGCSSCAWASRCAGFEIDYAAANGEAEFSPIRGAR